MLSLAILEIPTHSHVSIAGRVQSVMCKPPLVFTALSSVGIIKQGENQVSYVEGRCVSMAISTDTSEEASATLLTEIIHNVWSKFSEMAFSHPELNVSCNPPLAAHAQCVYGSRPCTRKAQGCFAKEDGLLDEEDDDLLQPYSQRRCLEVSWPGLAAGTSGGQQLICLTTR